LGFWFWHRNDAMADLPNFEQFRYAVAVVDTLANYKVFGLEVNQLAARAKEDLQDLAILLSEGETVRLQKKTEAAVKRLSKKTDKIVERLKRNPKYSNIEFQVY
jgi:hypothetical protein